MLGLGWLGVQVGLAQRQSLSATVLSIGDGDTIRVRQSGLEDGRLRLGTDALHQSLLAGLPGVLQVPPCFHPAGDWATLVA